MAWSQYELDEALAFVEEQTSVLEAAQREGWYADAIRSIQEDRDRTVDSLREAGYGQEAKAAIDRGKAARTMRSANKGKKRTNRTTLRWKKTSSKGKTIYEAKLPADSMSVVVGDAAGGWVVGLFNEQTDTLQIYDGYLFRSPEAAKLEVQSLIDATVQDVRRVANREIGDIVLAAEQYHEAQQDELDLMKRGTPEQLSRARKRTKRAKEALEDISGANRELYGSMGGGTLGAAVGALFGNPFAAAIGALAGSVVGSLLGRPSLPSQAPRDGDGARSEPGGGDVVPFRRPYRPRAANR